MKKLFILSLILVSFRIFSQDALPPNPQVGKCYIRCVSEDVWGKKNVQVTKIPGYTDLEVLPSEFKTEEEQVMVKPAYKKLEIIPAVFKKVTDTLQVEDDYNKITLIPAKFTDVIEEVIVQPAYARFESRSAMENCKSKNPWDCVFLCYVEYPEVKVPFPIKKVEAATSSSKQLKPGKKITVTKEVLVSPATTREIEVPAVYKKIKVKRLVKDETVKEIAIEPRYETQETRVLEKAGGMANWEEIDCKLTDFNILPIFYELNSARLTSESREIIDEKLFKLMKEKPNIRIEINSHTDSRDSDEYNMDLSQRRAQSVVDYLVSKGIRTNRLVAKGYGESRLKEPCPNGSDCTEEQHAKNRRTEFRVLTN